MLNRFDSRFSCLHRRLTLVERVENHLEVIDSRLEQVLRENARHVRTMLRARTIWRELDSSMSSDALLMNVFCYPNLLSRPHLTSLLGVDLNSFPEFGVKARVPLKNGRVDRTEIDLRLGTLLVESKLTESNFQQKAFSVLESYRDLEHVFFRRSRFDQRFESNSARRETKTLFQCGQCLVDRANLIGVFDLRIDQTVEIRARRLNYHRNVFVSGIEFETSRTEESKPRAPIQLVKRTNDVCSTLLEKF